MRVLILGGYGFIGLEAARLIIARGHEVTALGRAVEFGRRALPDARWIKADIAELSTPAAWAEHLRDIDAVVNASGALQDGARDDVAAVQATAIAALVAACETAGVKRIVQISAPGTGEGASTPFLRTKALGDASVTASKLDWVILRPVLVWGRTATGGTALVRMLAAFPLVQPLTALNGRIQIVDIDDVSACIARAVEGEIAPSSDMTLAAPETYSLRQMVALVRAWQGFAPAPLLPIPRAISACIAWGADIAGWLGWRSPLRSTSLRALEQGAARSDAPSPIEATSFADTLQRRPATRQDRLFARIQLALPLILLCLAAFWIASGVIGLIHADEAARIIEDAVASPRQFVIAGSCADIGLGVALLWRPWARSACWGIIALTGAYLIAGSLLTPHLWLDPLGPLVKTIPAAVLALVCAALLDER